MSIVLDNLELWGRGVQTTVSLTSWSWLLAAVIGVLVAAARVSPIPPLRVAGAVYTELIRNCPLTVLFVLFFFGLPEAGVIQPRFTSAVIVLGIYTSTFVAEVVRSGVNAVATGQAESARALGLTFTQVMVHVVMPQSLRTVVAPLGNVFIALVKNTSIAYTISVVELTGTAQRLAIENAAFFPAFTAAATAYVAIALPSGWLVGVIERKVAVRR